MAELDKKIARLEEEIEGYKAEYKTVSAAQEKSEIRQTIKSRTETLKRLLDEKKTTIPQGEYNFVQRYVVSITIFFPF